MNQEEEDKKDNNTQAPQLAGAATSVPTANTSTQPAAAPSVNKAASSGNGGGFNQYLNANKGAAQDKLNSTVAGSVSGQGKLANTAINQANTQFNTKVDAGSLQNRDTAVSDVNNIVNTSVRGISPTTNTVVAPAAAAPATPPAPAVGSGDGSALNDEQSQRFADVINAKYQGPESLRQSGLYQQASGKVGTAQRAINNAKTAQGREELLQNIYEQRGDYGRGQNKLDSALVNSSATGVNAITGASEAAGNVQDKLDQSQIASAAQAQNRTSEIANIQDQARNTFNTGLNDERAGTETRIGGVLDQWEKLPEYFRDIIRNKGTNNAAALAAESAKLGNAPDARAIAAADKALKNARVQNMLYGEGGSFSSFGAEGSQIDPKYASDVAEAQARYDQLNGQSQAYNSQLEALKQRYNPNSVNFSAEEAAMIGLNSGEGLYNAGADIIKSGVADKTKLISKNEQGRQAMLAKLAGLDKAGLLDKNIGNANQYADASRAGTQTIRDSLDTAETRKALNKEENDFQAMANGRDITGYGSKKNKTNGKTYRAEDSANLGNLLKASGYNLDGKNNADTGNNKLMNNLESVSNMNQISDKELNGLSGAAAAEAKGFVGGDSNTALGKLGNYAGGIGLNYLTGALGLGGFGDAIEGAFGGGANTKKSKNDAKIHARKDLNNKVKDALSSSGFDNRTNVSNEGLSEDRLSALNKLVANLDKTNGK